MSPSRAPEDRSSASAAAPEPLFGAAPLVVFVGRGGAGKTTTAAGSALAEARSGRRVLVASIDPAHSLGDALGRPLGGEPSRVALEGAELWACELEGARTWERWLERHRAPLRTALARGTWFEEHGLDRLLDLAPPGLSELMAWEELERLARDPRFDRVLVDAAPTGHLERLVDAPSLLARLADSLAALNAKHRVLARSLGGTDGADPTARAIEELAGDAVRVAAWLRDPERCAFVWVVRADPAGLEETLAGLAQLEALGPRPAGVVLSRATPEAAGACARCNARAAADRELERGLRRLAPGVPVRRVPQLAREPRGRGLGPVARTLARQTPTTLRPRRRRAAAATACAPPPASRGAPAWLQRLAPDGLRLLVVTGKGGVGKSTAASALALLLARVRTERPVLLLSVDPAHAIGERLGLAVGDAGCAPVPGLQARELDSRACFESHRRRLLARVDAAFETGPRIGRAAHLDREALRRLVDAAPPGLDELAALLALLDQLRPAREEPRAEPLVVLDTPATGHALELLALPGRALEWVHATLSLLVEQPPELRPRPVVEGLLDGARSLRALRALLADAERTRCVAVTHAAELPRRETLRLARGLEGLGVSLGAVLVNASVASAPSGCAPCRRAAAEETRRLHALWRDLPPRGAADAVRILAARTDPAPRGVEALAAWARTWRSAPASPER